MTAPCWKKQGDLSSVYAWYVWSLQCYSLVGNVSLLSGKRTNVSELHKTVLVGAVNRWPSSFIASILVLAPLLAPFWFLVLGKLLFSLSTKPMYGKCFPQHWDHSKSKVNGHYCYQSTSHSMQMARKLMQTWLHKKKPVYCVWNDWCILIAFWGPEPKARGKDGTSHDQSSRTSSITKTICNHIFTHSL